MAGWVDTHGHLFLLDGDPADTIGRARGAGVDWLVCPGIDVETSIRSRDLASAFPGFVQWSAGLHPNAAGSWDELGDQIAELVVGADAIGECGLDYYRDLAARGHQQQAFREQLGLAREHGKPAIIHCRDAFADVYEAVAEADLGANTVLHCWTGGRRWTKRFRELGVTFSFAGVLTYPTADTLRLAAAEVPPDRAMVETDAPYLTPEPLRSESNEPAHVRFTGAALADVWGMDVGEVAALTSARAASVFGDPRG